MNNTIKYSILALTMSVVTAVIAQKPEEEEERLNGGSITVIKPYDPTISDAFKIKSIPTVSDTTKTKKKPVTYSIFSVPVASTFTPATGQLSTLKKKKQPKHFDNYARLGLGNYTNVLAEFAANLEVDKDADIGIFLNHNSSQGGIEEAFFDDDFSDNSLALSYDVRTKQANWNINAGAGYQTANLYGVHEPFRLLIADPDAIDTGVNYLTYGLGGTATFFDSVLSEAQVGLTGLSSGTDATEMRITIAPRLNFAVVDSEIGLGILVDYLQGSFGQQGLPIFPTDYGYLSTTINPSINLYGDNYKATFGARINYLNDSERSEGKLNFYPAIDASYIVAEEKLVAYTSINGDLDMNSLQQFAGENPFLAPAIAIMPTNRQLDAQLGIKGKLTAQFSYRVYAGYRIENDRFFYTKDAGNQTIATVIETRPFVFGNVFYTQYGDLNTAFGGASLGFDVNETFNITLNGQFNNYTVKNGVDFGNVASHLPKFTSDIVANYKLNEQWNLGATLYFVGERDVWRNGEGASTLDAFVDLNIDITYKINPKLSAFLRGNNLTGGNYEFYQDFAVQSLQVMGGAVYKFDF